MFNIFGWFYILLSFVAIGEQIQDTTLIPLIMAWQMFIMQKLINIEKKIQENKDARN